MGYHVTHRYGAMSSAPGIHTFPALLGELKTRAHDEEHGKVSVTNDAEWCIAVNLSGIVTLENLESGDPRHMKQVPGARSWNYGVYWRRGMLQLLSKSRGWLVMAEFMRSLGDVS